MIDETAGTGLCLCQQDAYLRSLTTTVVRCFPVETPPPSRHPHPPLSAAAAKGVRKDNKAKGGSAKPPGCSSNTPLVAEGPKPAIAVTADGTATGSSPSPPLPCSGGTPGLGRYEVYLAETPMFPESGGQPCDIGQLFVVPSADQAVGVRSWPVVNVVAVMWKEGALCHLTDASLEPGTRVEVRLDWQRRYDHMQQHTGQHVFSAVADLLLGADTASWELHPLDPETHGSGDYGCVAVDLTVPQLSAEQLLELEARANAELRALRPVTPLVLDPRVAADMERMEVLQRDPTFRGQLPPADKIKGGKVRLVHVEGLDANACGGEVSTGEVQVLKVVGAERTRGHTRVRVMCGGRALAALAGCLTREAALTAKLTCPPWRHADMVELLLRDRREGAKARKLLAAELAERLGRELAQDGFAAAASSSESASLGLGAPDRLSWAVLHRPASDLDFLSLVAAAALEAASEMQVLLLTTDNTDPQPQQQRQQQVASGDGKGASGVEDSLEVMFLVAGRPDLVKVIGPRVAEALGGRAHKVYQRFDNIPRRFQGKAIGLFRLPSAVQAFKEAAGLATVHLLAIMKRNFVIKLRPDLAPDTCLLVWELAQKANCPGCNFYRHEPVPMNWGQEGFYGPPYALLQGSLQDLARQPPFENAQKLQVNQPFPGFNFAITHRSHVLNLIPPFLAPSLVPTPSHHCTHPRKGHVCIIPNCKEFFIATADHPEWGASHTIFGEVEDLSAEPSYPFEPFHTATNSDKITTRWLDNAYAFNLTAIEPVALPAPAAYTHLQLHQGLQQQQQQQQKQQSDVRQQQQHLLLDILPGISPGVLLDRMEASS
ncbi:hypothetical protein VOLCADRAFT_92618 [Volvox carteri f. nagariensis]|uniref:Uncharacterized protein n=1 Tax=Volvox carteri f. nagariensis TaxID=3068 RepID=D8U043_VOLCA|nr:uncharacterized protein VOLCADRAFT_92618 [Volvox carteri f. nagariensis]EFJ46801.1 hypothetical protein VOLCADRAFT_92618 [Volvox carteri f. nagariensis]|eukprot:XP_002952010.1 hypothetical protein VOLCADRAFT_92618 [Volvox carteri f. nagariensis]